MAPIPDVVVLKINIPYLKLQKAIRVNSGDLVWNLKRQVEEKVAAEIKEVLNYGIFVHGKDGKKGKYLDERNTVASYHLDGSSKIDFQLKTRVGGETMDHKKQKKFMEDIQKGLLEKVKEKTTKTTDFNFVYEGGTL
jgi:N-terminal or F0 domain of Talin-head FERM